MHSLNAALVIFRKEFREVFRDRRSVFNIVISPLLLTPLIIILAGTVTAKQVQSSARETVPIGLVGVEHAPQVKAALGTPRQVRWQVLTREQAEAEIHNHAIRAALIVPPDADAQFAQSRILPLTILVDSGNTGSQEAAQKVRAVLEAQAQKLLAARLQASNLSPDLATPFKTREESIKSGGNPATLLLSTFLPYMLAIYAIVGGVSAANDAVAGEKERGTLETLLLSPVSRRQLVLGKYATIACVSLISSLLSVAGLLWPFLVGSAVFPELAHGGLMIGPGAILAILLVQVPLSVFGAGVLLMVSTYARNQKEAQTYLAPVLVLVSVAAMLSLVLKTTDVALGYAVVPILNAALVLKQALEGSFDVPFIAVACTTSLLYAGLVLWSATRLFEKESVLLKA